ncbi:MAG: YdcF family protein [Microcoleus vaginatus WJT46-NPBG5]|jgi:uncharacterized SAM-binding protein YcdF (DUF218 family)|nr:YdcF family protein [Microcoleus vaginatus WJT46-NPBG5]
MFLFLSKLLPIFIYPLGLSCLLMLVALVIVWKRPRWAAAVISLAWIILLLGSNGWVAQGLVRSLEWQNLPATQLPQADAIVVLGGAVKPAFSPRPWVDVSEAGDRILHGAQLYRQGKAPFLILSGGRIEWKGGGPAESEDMAKIAETMGVPKDAILQDPTSLNTHENAVNVRKILDSQGIRRQVLLVTSAMHMPRSLLIFKRQGIQATPAPTDFLVSEQELQEINSSWQSTLLNILPDADNLQQTTKALKEYIGLVVYRLRGWL